MTIVVTPEDAANLGMGGPVLQGSTATVHDVGDVAALPADLGGAGPGSGSRATDARARRQPGDHDRMTLRLFLNV